MLNSEWSSLFNMFPRDQQSSLVIATKSGIELAVDILIKTEGDCLVFRGRVCGSTDEGRGFFLPYDSINCVYINRFVKAKEVFALYGESPPEGFEDKDPDRLADGQKPGEAAAPPSPEVPPPPAAAPGGSHPGAQPQPILPPPAPAGTPRVGEVPIRPAAGLPSNVPAAALQPPGAGRLTQVSPSSAGGASAVADEAPPAPPRNNILERLRAQRNTAPPRPPKPS